MEDVKLSIDQYSINITKGIIMDTVRNADSGHTGGPLSSLDFTYILFKEFLKFDPDDPTWENRDRFVLSIGHESALLYAMLSLVGWLDIEELKNFRQLGSRTPGHPEKGLTPGVEATTGPLGQGVGNAVGMAIAERILASKLSDDIVDHFTYVLHGDGDIQEPVAQGSIAIAGHFGLGKLIAFYDSNNAQISGKVSRSDSTDYAMMYKSHGWHVQEIDGHDHDAIRSAIRIAQMEIEKPSVIIGNTIMAKGCANVEGDYNTHGAPLSPEEIAQTKQKLGLDPEKFFVLPDEVLEDFQKSYDYARDEVAAWKKVLSDKLENDAFKKMWNQATKLELPDTIKWPSFDYGETIATRKVWGKVIEELAEKGTFLVGGSADLEPSNMTVGFAKMVGDFSKDNQSGMNLPYGVREFPMGAINNGIGLHGGLFVFGATFFVFADYERPAIRLRALQKLPVISEFTHDSIYVGEDGPTHQPIEHLMSYRAIPNLLVIRPADANEAVVAAKIAFESKDRPSLVLLTRQGLPVFDREIYPAPCSIAKGGYVMCDHDNPDVMIIATGSEVWIALEVKEMLTSLNIKVVNLACWELFEDQDSSYKNNVLKCAANTLIVSVEAGITDGWQKYTGRNGLNIGINTFGESAPGKMVAEHFKLTPEGVADKIKNRRNNA
jgi:transketolase